MYVYVRVPCGGGDLVAIGTAIVIGADVAVVRGPMSSRGWGKHHGPGGAIRTRLEYTRSIFEILLQ